MKNWNFMKKTALMIAAFFSIAEIPINAAGTEVDFSADQVNKLKALHGEDFVENLKASFNAELKAMADNNLDLKAIQDDIDAMVAQNQLTADELDAAGGKDENTTGVSAAIKALSMKSKEQEKLIAKLMMEDYGDVIGKILPLNADNKALHSATHLFASNKDWDGVDRPWNRNAAKGVHAATNFMDQPTVQKLNNDLELYYRENPTQLKSLTRDTNSLPDFWPTRTKVDDKVADGNIATAEISQARKMPWLPKNRQLIKAEEGQIFPIQIDIEYVGYYLQKIEASWLNMMNKEGSQPYKESFVKFLVSEIDKKARIEDRVATIKGIYVQTPEGATEGGRFMNRQNGLLYLLSQARDVTKKFRAFDLGLPTEANILDYVDNFIKRLPQDIRETQGLVLYLSDELLRAYKRKYEVVHGLNNNYEGYPVNPKDYPNIAFQRIVDMAGSQFMFMTFNDNIELLENVPAEKSMYKFEYLLRKMYVWADYKMGVRLIHIGSPVEANDPLEFAVQTVWSNTAPIFPAETFIPLLENTATTLDVKFGNYEVSKDRTLNITELKNAPVGQVIRIKGNVLLTGSPVVKHSLTKLVLAGNADFALNSGGTITIFVPVTGVPRELSRTAAPATAVVADVAFTSAVIDANLGQVFNFTGSSTTAIVNVINGVEGKTIRIYGTDTAGVDVTLSDVGNVNVAAPITLAVAANYVELTLVSGTWYETAKLV